MYIHLQEMERSCHKMTPIEYTSALKPYDLPAMISGAMYIRVPALDMR